MLESLLTPSSNLDKFDLSKWDFVLGAENGVVKDLITPSRVITDGATTLASDGKEKINIIAGSANYPKFAYSDDISVHANTVWTYRADVTILTNIRLNDDGNSLLGIFAQDNIYGAAGLFFKWTDNPSLIFTIYATGGRGSSQIPEVVANSEFEMAVTRNGNIITFFINGRLVSNHSFNFDYAYNKTAPMSIGKMQSGANPRTPMLMNNIAFKVGSLYY